MKLLIFQKSKELSCLRSNKCMFDEAKNCNHCFSCIGLINKKKPEVLKLVMLRMVFILVFVNMMFLTFALGVTWWAEEGDKNSPKGRMISGLYAEEFPYMEDYSFKNFMEQATSCMRYMEKEEYEKMDEGTIDLMVDFGYRALAENTGEEREEMYEIQKAYYVGYWGLSEEELAFLEPDNGSEYESLFPDLEKKSIDILVNTTPVGMYPNVDGCPVSVNIINNSKGLLVAR